MEFNDASRYYRMRNGVVDRRRWVQRTMSYEGPAMHGIITKSNYVARRNTSAAMGEVCNAQTSKVQYGGVFICIHVTLLTLTSNEDPKTIETVSDAETR